jgi:large subunit ribosomal protein L25
MQQRPKLKVEKREIHGKEVRKLRRTGVIPANVYGADFKSTAVQLSLKEFDKVYGEVHETGLVDLELGSETIPILIKNVQRDYVKDVNLHADFHKVNLKEKVEAKVPIEAVGEAKAEMDKVGLLEQPMMELEIEALPTELPEKIEVKVEGLALVDQQITVSQLTVPTGVSVLSDPDQVVFKVGELVTREMEEQMAADEAAAEAATEETAEGAEGEAKAEEGQKDEGESPAGGETKTEEGKDASVNAGQEKTKEEAPKE